MIPNCRALNSIMGSSPYMSNGVERGPTAYGVRFTDCGSRTAGETPPARQEFHVTSTGIPRFIKMNRVTWLRMYTRMDSTIASIGVCLDLPSGARMRVKNC